MQREIFNPVEQFARLDAASLFFLNLASEVVVPAAEGIGEAECDALFPSPGLDENPEYQRASARSSELVARMMRDAADACLERAKFFEARAREDLKEAERLDGDNA